MPPAPAFSPAGGGISRGEAARTASISSLLSRAQHPPLSRTTNPLLCRATNSLSSRAQENDSLQADRSLESRDLLFASHSQQRLTRPAFHYWDKGSLATIGRAAAVADFGKFHISGFLAWLSWLFIHIFFLIGFRNRILVFIQWAWSYFTYERGARLITGSTNLPGWTQAPPAHAESETLVKH